MHEESHAMESDWNMAAPDYVRNQMASIEHYKEILAEDEQILKADVRKRNMENEGYRGDLISMKQKVINYTLKAERAESERFEAVYKEVNGLDTYIHQKLISDNEKSQREKAISKGENKFGVFENALMQSGESMRTATAKDGLYERMLAEQKGIGDEIVKHEREYKEHSKSIAQLNAEIERLKEKPEAEQESGHAERLVQLTSDKDNLLSLQKNAADNLRESKHNQSTFMSRVEALERDTEMHAEGIMKRGGEDYADVGKAVTAWKEALAKAENEVLASMKTTAEYQNADSKERANLELQARAKARLDEKLMEKHNIAQLQKDIHENVLKGHKERYGFDFNENDRRGMELFKRYKAMGTGYINEEVRDVKANKEYFQEVFNHPDKMAMLLTGQVGDLVKNPRAGMSVVLSEYYSPNMSREAINGLRKTFNSLSTEGGDSPEGKKARDHLNENMKAAFGTSTHEEAFAIMDAHLKDYATKTTPQERSRCRIEFANKYELGAINFDQASIDPVVPQDTSRNAHYAVAQAGGRKVETKEQKDKFDDLGYLNEDDGEEYGEEGEGGGS